MSDFGKLSSATDIPTNCLLGRNQFFRLFPSLSVCFARWGVNKQHLTVARVLCHISCLNISRLLSIWFFTGIILVISFSKQALVYKQKSLFHTQGCKLDSFGMIVMVPPLCSRINLNWLLGLKLTLNLMKTKIKQNDCLFYCFTPVFKTFLSSKFNLLGFLVKQMENTEKKMFF